MNQHPALPLAKVLREQGKAVEADTELENALRHVNREANEYVFQLLPPVYQSLHTTGATDHADALIRELLASEAAWHEQSGPVAAAPYSLAFLCAAADVGAFALIAPVVRARLAWWEKHRPADAPAHAYAVLAGEVLLAERRLDEAEQMLLAAAEGLQRTRQYWNSEPVWRAGHLDGALARFYAVCDRPEEPGRWRQLMNGGSFDPEWELALARILFDGGRYREAAEILPGARSRAEEQLARKPDHDRLAAIVAKAAALREECLAKLESQLQAHSLIRRRK